MIKIKKNILLTSHTTFKIGGPAKYFVEVSDEGELIEAIKYAKDNKLDFFILGGGSNILVNDQGYDGLVVKVKNQKSKIKTANQNSKVLVECWAGGNLASLVNFSAENGFTGLEWAAGIPGTVGGAIFGNAGAFGKSMADNIENVRAIKIDENNNYKIENCKKEDCQFEYRSSIFKKNRSLIILSCLLNLNLGDKEKISTRTKENLKRRAEKQPIGLSAGSFFKNPVVKNEAIVEKFEKSTGLKTKDDKIPAGWLISEAGLKGKRIGNIQVSEQHANFILNLGEGRAEDVVILTSLIKQKVRTEFNVQLSEEVVLLGF